MKKNELIEALRQKFLVYDYKLYLKLEAFNNLPPPLADNAPDFPDDDAPNNDPNVVLLNLLRCKSPHQ